VEVAEEASFRETSSTLILIKLSLPSDCIGVTEDVAFSPARLECGCEHAIETKAKII